MNKILLTIYLLFTGFNLFAQVNIDSLSSVWQDTSLSNTIRLKAINDIAREYGQRKPDSAFYFAQLQYDLAKNTGHLLWQARALDTQSYSFQMKGDLKQAQDLIGRSLKLYEELGDENGIARSQNITGTLLLYAGDYEKAIAHYLKSIIIYEEQEDKDGLSSSYTSLGTAYSQQGNYIQALHYLNRGRRLSEELGNKRSVLASLNTIGFIYMEQLDNERALECYFQVLEGSEQMNDKRGIAGSLSNIGAIYSKTGEREKAIDHFKRSMAIAEEMGFKRGVIGLQVNIGRMYFEQGEHDLAMEYFTESLKGAEEIGSKSQVTLALIPMVIFHQEKNNLKTALVLGKRAVKLAKEVDDHQLIKTTSALLSAIYKTKGEYQRSMEMYELSILMKDSLKNEENQKAIIEQQFVFDYEKKSLADHLKAEEAKLVVELAHEKEVHKKEQQRNIMLAGGFCVLLLAAGLWSRLRYTKKAKIIIEKEKDRSEELLLNILPEEVAAELKEKGAAEAQLIEHVSVIFTDFKGFTALAELLSPKELVNDLNICFSEFDHIMQKNGIEKIKTIGDAYMAAGGLPTPNHTHALDVIQSAFEMRDFVADDKARKIAANLPYFEIRIGVHTGPVVAGIVGVKKFQYDIWGDTVNTASRMESSGEVGKVNISQATYDLLKDDLDFSFEKRGKIEAKGKGEIEMYFVYNK